MGETAFPSESEGFPMSNLSTLPPVGLVIIVAIAAVMSRAKDFIQKPMVRGAFIGLIACIVGMVFSTAIRMWKKVMTEPLAYVVAACSLVGLAVFKLPPVWLILGAIAVGIAAQTVTVVMKRGGEKE